MAGLEKILGVLEELIVTVHRDIGNQKQMSEFGSYDVIRAVLVIESHTFRVS